MNFKTKKIIGHNYVRFRSFFSSFRQAPAFIIIGAQKGGTSSLFDYLNQHPKVNLSIKKETHYYDKYYKKGYKWYKGFFPFKSKNIITGEATPCYLKHPLIAERIKKDMPNVKLIIMIRNPIDRAYSHYNMMRREKIEPIDSFESAIQKEDERLSGEHQKLKENSDYFSFNHQYYSYLFRGKYYSQFKPWFFHFKNENILIIKSEDFFMAPKEVLTSVYNFLKIETIFPNDLKAKNVGNYSSKLDKITISKLEKYFELDTKQLEKTYNLDLNWFNEK